MFLIGIPVSGPIQTEEDMQTCGFHYYVIIIYTSVTLLITYKTSSQNITISPYNSYQDATNYSNINVNKHNEH